MLNCFDIIGADIKKYATADILLNQCCLIIVQHRKYQFSYSEFQVCVEVLTWDYIKIRAAQRFVTKTNKNPRIW